MTSRWTPHVLLIAALIAGVVTYFGVKADRLVRIGAGYKAKIACSEIFVAGRDADEILTSEFDGMAAAMRQVTAKVDRQARQVRAAGPLGLGGVRAIYRDGYGCTLANGGGVSTLPAPGGPANMTSWEEAPPRSEGALARVNYAALNAAMDDAFGENGAHHRAVLVAVDGMIVSERYADGFSRETPFLSWSMAKSVTATLVGAAALRGLVEVNDPAPVAEWHGDSARSAITWNDLLRMQSGLAFGEDYDAARSDVNRMLFEEADAGGFAANMTIDHAPGEHWYYSSGTSNLIARTLRQALAADGVDFYQFARETVFDPVGASNVVLEPDASGSFIGSSYVYATARDWARLGQLYLQDGVWDGERLLPEGWVDYVRRPTTASNGQYGAQFWLNFDGGNGRVRFFEGLPEEMFYFAGHEGQYVFIIPDKRMVIVRTGLTRGRSPVEATTPLIKAIYDAVDAPDGA